MRIVQTERKYEKIWSACFSEAKSQVWGIIRRYEIRPEGRALVGDKRRFLSILASTKIDPSRERKKYGPRWKAKERMVGWRAKRLLIAIFYI